MSLVQDFPQNYPQFGSESHMSYHHRTSSASSILAAAATYGNGYNHHSGPHSGSQGYYGNSSHPPSWQSHTHNSASPSIWSHQYNGSVQWPVSSHNRQQSLGGNHGYMAQHQSAIPHAASVPPLNQHHVQSAVPSGHHRHYSVNPVPVQLVQGYGHNLQQHVHQPVQQPVQQPVHQTVHQTVQQQPMMGYNPQPVLLMPSAQQQPQQVTQQQVPQQMPQQMPQQVTQQQLLQPIAQAMPQQMPQQVSQQQLQQQQLQQQQFHHLLQAPRLMPHYIQPIVPSQYQLYQRAPYQAPSSEQQQANNAPITEYDLPSFAKFMLSVCIGIVEESVSLEETQKFETFIETMLYATRLQLSTLFMSLVFLNKSNKVCGNEFKSLPLRKRLVCALILANKMHDDNTFTNASWSVVSEIPTKEITSLEAKCLDAFNWDLSMGEKGMTEWYYWQKCWQDFIVKVQSPSPVASPPVNGNMNVLGSDALSVAAAC